MLQLSELLFAGIPTPVARAAHRAARRPVQIAVHYLRRRPGRPGLSVLARRGLGPARDAAGSQRDRRCRSGHGVDEARCGRRLRAGPTATPRSVQPPVVTAVRRARHGVQQIRQHAQLAHGGEQRSGPGPALCPRQGSATRRGAGVPAGGVSHLRPPGCAGVRRRSRPGATGPRPPGARWRRRWSSATVSRWRS